MVGIRAYCRWIVSYSWRSMTTLIFHIKIIFLHYIDALASNITFFTHLCLHYNDCDGSFEAHIEVMHMGWNQFKWTKSYVKMSIFSNLFSHLSRWCHFNGMLNHGKLWFITNMDVTKFKLNHYMFQFWILVWANDI
jgi:hypothetical protein